MGTHMPRLMTGFGLLALIIGLATPASAEFFGCNDHTSRNASAYTAQASARITHEFAAQSARPRVTIHPRRQHLTSASVRQCRTKLVKEYRPSGTVIVPRTTCWWE
jgi:hypothetical protein